MENLKDLNPKTMSELYSDMANYHKDFVCSIDESNNEFNHILNELTSGDHTRSIEVSERVLLLYDEECEYINNLIIWKNELLMTQALPNNILTKFLIIISGLYRLKSLLRVSIDESCKRLKEYANLSMKEKELIKLRKELNRKDIELNFERLRCMESKQKLKSAISMILRLKAERKYFRWYRLYMKLLLKHSKKPRIIQKVENKDNTNTFSNQRENEEREIEKHFLQSSSNPFEAREKLKAFKRNSNNLSPHPPPSPLQQNNKFIPLSSSNPRNINNNNSLFGDIMNDMKKDDTSSKLADILKNSSGNNTYSTPSATPRMSMLNSRRSSTMNGKMINSNPITLSNSPIPQQKKYLTIEFNKMNLFPITNSYKEKENNKKLSIAMNCCELNISATSNNNINSLNRKSNIIKSNKVSPRNSFLNNNNKRKSSVITNPRKSNTPNTVNTPNTTNTIQNEENNNEIHNENKETIEKINEIETKIKTLLKDEDNNQSSSLLSNQNSASTIDSQSLYSIPKPLDIEEKDYDNILLSTHQQLKLLQQQQQSNNNNNNNQEEEEDINPDELERRLKLKEMELKSEYNQYQQQQQHHHQQELDFQQWELKQQQQQQQQKQFENENEEIEIDENELNYKKHSPTNIIINNMKEIENTKKHQQIPIIPDTESSIFMDYQSPTRLSKLQQEEKEEKEIIKSVPRFTRKSVEQKQQKRKSSNIMNNITPNTSNRNSTTSPISKSYSFNSNDSILTPINIKNRDLEGARRNTLDASQWYNTNASATTNVYSNVTRIPQIVMPPPERPKYVISRKIK